VSRHKMARGGGADGLVRKPPRLPRPCCEGRALALPLEAAGVSRTNSTSSIGARRSDRRTTAASVQNCNSNRFRSPPAAPLNHRRPRRSLGGLSLAPFWRRRGATACTGLCARAGVDDKHRAVVVRSESESAGGASRGRPRFTESQPQSASLIVRNQDSEPEQEPPPTHEHKKPVH
jgi:hypothetical protein